MKYGRTLVGVVLLVVLAIGLLGSRALTAQDPLAEGTVLERMGISGSDGMEAIVVLRELPPGAESGRHKMEAGSEIVYIVEGSAIVEVDGMPTVTVEAGGTFQTVAGQVHNVKNASKEASCKALAFYISKQGTAVENLSLPAE